MKCSVLFLVLAGACVAAAGAADGTAAPVRHGTPTAEASAASQSGHVDARQLQRQHHAQDRHAQDVDHGRSGPCDALAGSQRDACRQRAGAAPSR